ncbi:MAG: hypothetical protein ACAI44_22985 [Candidatus Sericytochromatia bacterium]
MLDFAALATAKAKVQQRDQERVDDYEDCYQEALEELRLFRTLPVRERADSLQIVAEALAEALEYQRHRAEPYLLLAGIFYLLKHYRSAQRYLQIARNLEPNLEGLMPMQALVTEALRQGEQTVVVKAVPYTAPPGRNNWRINQ